ncbi:sugar kinase [Mycolicibacterium duvalii]|uniref:Glucokinase n=1 Tax=Mycolicibacterium duvalii TaxID=39688 RepID=A0A7I7K4W2_9MYCO|nr:ROK family protein [Mycolicibacterium duvalii]MCV7367811.1 ROK family protein [Mycolicibacterium duvalii]PEG42499.1 sugar kinase [Mycolicibacterium duvalii]BBX18598.1 glucokinase [Mycolicibacterium duvalii]
MTVLALDIGGTKLAAGVVDEDGTLLYRAVRPTPGGSADEIWHAIETLLTDVTRGSARRPGAVGVSSAGPIDVRRGTVNPINISAWNDFPIAARVSEATGLPVRLGGDGLCMTLGEVAHGAARGAGFVLGMVVSTGIGGGLVVDGRPVHGRSGNAGHVGHVVVEPDGLPCTCGGRGCVETVASGPSLVRWARSQGWHAPADADARVLAEAARAGDQAAVRAFRRGGDALARTISSVAAVCDLDLVVVGGGVAAAGPLLFDPLRAALSSYAGLDFLRGLRVVAAELGGDAGLVGAAVLAQRFG